MGDTTDPTTMPATIEVFADVACPFAHVSLRRLAAHRDEVGGGALLRVRAWPLEVVNGEPTSAQTVAEEVEALRAAVAPDLFAGFDPDRYPPTSLPALGLTAVASAAALRTGEAVALELRRLLFEEGVDVSRSEVLAAVARSHGVAWSPGDGTGAALADLEEGRERGVRGSPHFFAPGLDAFCPSLRVSKPEGRLQVESDPMGSEALHRALTG